MITCGHSIFLVIVVIMQQDFTFLELLCNLAPEAGQVGCLASMSAFYFDATSGECRPFVYSGCGGNANNFPSYGQCMKKCKGEKQFESFLL